MYHGPDMFAEVVEHIIVSRNRQRRIHWSEYGCTPSEEDDCETVYWDFPDQAVWCCLLMPYFEHMRTAVCNFVMAVLGIWGLLWKIVKSGHGEDDL